MNIRSVSPWLIRLIVIVTLPTIACSAFYSVTELNQSSGVLTILVSLAYPAILISAIGLVSQFLSPQYSQSKVIAWAAAFLLPLALLVFAWL